MVNTFITRYPLEEAILDLDSRRLGKQRVEAQQILTAILNAYAIARLYKLDECPSREGIEGDMEREKWYKSVYTFYKNKPRIYHDQNENYSLEMTKTHTKVVSIGFTMHPMTVMWVGYTDALRYYINLCILEWVKRGFQNTMKYHILFDDIPSIPWWAKSKAFHYSNCSALLRKEKCRNEPLWYWDLSHVRKIFGTPWYTSGYLWINNLSFEQRLKILNDDEDTFTFCAPINNDFP